MNPFLGTLFGAALGNFLGLALGAAAMLTMALASYRLGHGEGHKRGYEEGRVDAEAWWLHQGAEVDQERQNIEEKERRGRENFRSGI